MGNLFYDLPCEIIDKIYKINVLKDIKDYEVVGHFWRDGGEDNYYNKYKNNFTIWNGFDFKWTGNLGEDSYTNDYGTPECPIGSDYHIDKKYYRLIWTTPTAKYVKYNEFILSDGPMILHRDGIGYITSSSYLKQAEPV